MIDKRFAARAAIVALMVVSLATIAVASQSGQATDTTTDLALTTTVPADDGRAGTTPGSAADDELRSLRDGATTAPSSAETSESTTTATSDTDADSDGEDTGAADGSDGSDGSEGDGPRLPQPADDTTTSTMTSGDDADADTTANGSGGDDTPSTAVSTGSGTNDDTTTTRPTTTTTRPTTTTTRPTTTAAANSCEWPWELVFDEQFSGSSVNTSIWGTFDSTGNAGNGLRRPSALSVANAG